MAWRLLGFILCFAVAGALGWSLGAELGAAVGIAVGALAWVAADTWRGARVLRWSKAQTSRGAPLVGGAWGELSDRVSRALRSRELEVEDAQGRLHEFLAAIQASPNGVVLLDAQGRIEWCNQTAADHFGLDLRRDLQQQVGNLVRDPGFAAYYNGGNYAQEIVIPGPSGSAARPVRLSVQLHPYGEGRRLLLSRDVTAVQQAEAMRRDFVANVSHEIRTPLTVLMGFVETLQSLALNEEERARYLELMAQQGQRMQALVGDLLTLSRLEGSPLPGVGDGLHVPGLLARCEQDGRALAEALGKTLDWRVAQAPAVELAGSASELQSACANLVSNAVRYTPSGGVIDLEWRALPDGRGEFAVRDSGPGIAAEHVPRLTERFYRVDRSRSRETGGTGLGLAIVKHIAQRHGAELKIESTPGAGSMFAIWFPAHRLRDTLTPDEHARPATESQPG